LARFAQVATLLVVQFAILFLSAGRFTWNWAWIFLGIYFIAIIINGFFMMKTNPETVAERGRARLTRNWDKVVGGMWSLAHLLFVPLVAGLDLRFGWTQGLADWWNLGGAIVFAAGLELFSWAMMANAYFSTAARIQAERGQTVCKNGPYHFLRHPGYLGAILQSLGIPLLLGSFWALVPGVVAAALMVVRTSFEDRMLQSELTGYSEYAREARFRLLPGVW